MKYHDYFKFKGEPLLKGTILSIHKNSLRKKFKIDNTISSIKYGEIIDISDDNRHLVCVGKLLMTTFIQTLNIDPWNFIRTSLIFSSIKYGEIIDISDDNRHLVCVGKLLMTTFIQTLNIDPWNFIRTSLIFS